MAAGQAYKALAIAKNLQSDLNQRFALLGANLWSLNTDATSGYPTLSYGALTAASQSIFILINTQLSTAIKDSLGLQQTAFSPFVAQVVLESTTATITGAALSLLQMQNLLPALMDVASFLNRTEVYMSANGVGVSAAAIVQPPAVVFTTQIQYPGVGDV